MVRKTEDLMAKNRRHGDIIYHERESSGLGIHIAPEVHDQHVDSQSGQEIDTMSVLLGRKQREGRTNVAHILVGSGKLDHDAGNMSPRFTPRFADLR